MCSRCCRTYVRWKGGQPFHVSGYFFLLAKFFLFVKVSFLKKHAFVTLLLVVENKKAIATIYRSLILNIFIYELIYIYIIYYYIILYFILLYFIILYYIVLYYIILYYIILYYIILYYIILYYIIYIIDI